MLETENTLKTKQKTKIEDHTRENLIFPICSTADKMLKILQGNKKKGKKIFKKWAVKRNTNTRQECRVLTPQNYPTVFPLRHDIFPDFIVLGYKTK